MRQKKKMKYVLGLSFVIILSYLFFITIKNKSSIDAMDTLSININGSDTLLQREGEHNSLNVGQLSSTTDNKLTIDDISNIEKIKIDDEEIELKEEINFKIDEINKDKKIKISILYNGKNEYADYYINSYSTVFPGYEVSANSPYEGEYYLTTHNEEYNYVFKLNNEGELTFYKQVESNPFDFKKIITDDNEIDSIMFS